MRRTSHLIRLAELVLWMSDDDPLDVHGLSISTSFAVSVSLPIYHPVNLQYVVSKGPQAWKEK